jgi:hypothetical protein
MDMSIKADIVKTVDESGDPVIKVQLGGTEIIQKKDTIHLIANRIKLVDEKE